MRAVVQVVTQASVEVDGTTIGQIGPGLVVLVGVTHDDTPSVAERLAAKIWGLRVLPDEKSVSDGGTGVLAISQFTLYGDARKGRRPTWAAAAPGPVAEPLYDHFCQHLRTLGAHVETGRFGADMAVTLTNDGPTTVLLEISE